jgi:hypothetical protein
MTSVAFAIALSSLNQHVFIENISVSSPRTGTEIFCPFATNLNNLSLWRLVLKDDIAPRLPPSLFYWKHPGHTIQMSGKGIFCYYLHYGDDELGYARVPYTWNDVPYFNPVSGCLHHHIQAYIDYMHSTVFTTVTELIISSFVTSN